MGLASLALVGQFVALALVGQTSALTLNRPRAVGAPEQLTALVDALPIEPDEATTLESSLVQDSDLVAFAQGKSVVSTTIASLACGAIKLALGGSLVSLSPVNKTAITVNWSQACQTEPQCAVQPVSALQVSIALLIVNFFNVPFAVRSGGHSPNPGFANVAQGGILIDLQKFKEIIVSKDKKSVKVGPGLRWGEVQAALDPYGVSVIGGRIPAVGVGGLMLGGGLHHFSNEYGLAADNVKSFEIVLASGVITTASAQQNSDLFWALKGGGPNFGIVTTYELYTVPVTAIWLEVRIFPNDQALTLIDALAIYQNSVTDVKCTAAFVVGTDVTTLGLIYSGPLTKEPACFAPFKQITGYQSALGPGNSTMNILTQALGSTFNNDPARQPLNIYANSLTPDSHDYRAVSTKIDAQMYKDVYTFWAAKAAALRVKTGAGMTFAIQPIQASLAAASKAKGGNPTGIPAVNHQWWTTVVDWQKASDDAEVLGVPIATTEKWKALAKAKKLDLDFTYMNDASRDQNPIGSYGDANIKKLKTISKKYDPQQIFQNLQNDGFLLKKV
ncbi:hypothetical protein B0T17DRAFT_483089 [Bombardia bombarda]|uniref:FAD-binding PCMH-type domain-containing protein n=1 Tax=Bombardia bombarda TaxID=252184 RepID=A0AA39XP13_9PEZI|nr:hypothetical protein B0T17DRAFT_483089 [Bombardia bombarda]